ncbi:unnamed protein product, partial [Trichogramma brassicae]
TQQKFLRIVTPKYLQPFLLSGIQSSSFHQFSPTTFFCNETIGRNWICLDQTLLMIPQITVKEKLVDMMRKRMNKVSIPGNANSGQNYWRAKSCSLSSAKSIHDRVSGGIPEPPACSYTYTYTYNSIRKRVHFNWTRKRSRITSKHIKTLCSILQKYNWIVEILCWNWKEASIVKKNLCVLLYYCLFRKEEINQEKLCATEKNITNHLSLVETPQTSMIYHRTILKNGNALAPRSATVRCVTRAAQLQTRMLALAGEMWIC